MYVYADLQAEVKRRALRDQAGSEFNEAIKHAVNLSLLRVAREQLWRVLRRTAVITTNTTYTTGSGGASVTADSKNVTVTGATFITDGIQIGRKITFQGSGTYFSIATITGETTLTLNLAYDGVTASSQTYSILPQEEYVLPPQVSHRMFLWHRQYGYPVQMGFVPDQEFRSYGITDTTIAVPDFYRMWGQNMIIEQPIEPSVISVSSSSSSDTSCAITIFGTVSGYPDYEIINVNGTSTVAGTKVFSSVERVSKSASTVGRITATSNSANVINAVMPVGDTTAGIMYSKIQLWPLPNAVGEIYCDYYKDPYRLVNDNDIHELGSDFDESIILLAVAKLKYENSQSEGDRFYAMYKDELQSVKKTNVDKIDWIKKLKRPWDNSLRARLQRNLTYLQIGSTGNFGPMSYR